MSIAWTNRVWRDSSAKGTHLLVLLALADNADEATGLAWPSVAYLMRKTRLSERPVQRALQALADRSELAIVARPGHSNHYRLLGGVELTGGRIDGGAETPGRGGASAGGGVAVAPPITVSEPSKNRQLRAQRSQLPRDFAFGDDLRGIATQAGCRDGQRLFAAFVDYWRATGKAMADWRLTFRTWARRAHGGPTHLACGCGGLPSVPRRPPARNLELERQALRDKELGIR